MSFISFCASIFPLFYFLTLKEHETTCSCTVYYISFGHCVYSLNFYAVCPASSWKRVVSMLCTVLVSMFSLRFSYVQDVLELVTRKEEGREWEMEGWSERWVIFSVRHCCFPLSPVIFTQKWMPGSGWKKELFFSIHIWCNFMMEADCD